MDWAFTSATQLWQRFTLTRYLVASVIALGIDVGIYSALVAFNMLPVWASALGYSAGIFVHWMISSNFVFLGKRRGGMALHLQRALFAGSALVGLGITMAIVALATGLGVSALPSKIAAVAVSFFGVYLIRKRGVFS